MLAGPFPSFLVLRSGKTSFPFLLFQVMASQLLAGTTLDGADFLGPPVSRRLLSSVRGSGDEHRAGGQGLLLWTI